MVNNCLLFIQNRPQRAGAQTSLRRITGCEEIASLNPVVITASHGWLNDALHSHQVPHYSIPWPSPRSLAARIGGLNRHARKTATKLQNDGITPTAVIANDHQECLVAHAIAHTLGGLPVFAILRTPGMSRRDFTKYRCDECHTLFARGHVLAEQVTKWTDQSVICVEGSFSHDERMSPVERPDQFPNRILVAGSEEPRKGFADFIEGLAIAEREHPDFPALECVFTGQPPEQTDPAGKHVFRSSFQYVGRVNDFIQLAREFSLAIHPSRSESFGMAPLELMLAGVPTLVSMTGVIEKLGLPKEWCFAPESPRDIADRLIKLRQRWPDLGLKLTEIQTLLLERYPISNTAHQLAKHIRLTPTHLPKDE